MEKIDRDREAGFLRIIYRNVNLKLNKNKDIHECMVNLWLLNDTKSV